MEDFDIRHRQTLVPPRKLHSQNFSSSIGRYVMLCRSESFVGRLKSFRRHHSDNLFSILDQVAGLHKRYFLLGCR